MPFLWRRSRQRIVTVQLAAYLLNTVKDIDSISLATKEEIPLDLAITIGHNTLPTTIKQTNCYESFEQLGVWANAAGDMMDKLKDNVDYSMRISKRVKKKSVSVKNMFRLYKNIWLPLVQYPLAVTFFTKQQCLEIMKPFVHAILPKLGFNWNMAREIIYGASKCSGFQMAHLHLEQSFLAENILIAVTGN
eukprot:4740587-Ditylum_brightwellii.AAC.1